MSIFRKLFGLKKKTKFEDILADLKSRRDENLRILETLKHKEELHLVLVKAHIHTDAVSRYLARWRRFQKQREEAEQSLKKIEDQIQATELNMRFYAMVQSSSLAFWRAPNDEFMGSTPGLIKEKEKRCHQLIVKFQF